MRESNTKPQAASVASPFGEPLDIHALLTTPPPPLHHVLPGLLAGTVGMLAGPGGVGKTMLELQIAVGLATGTPVCGGLYEAAGAAPVVMVAAEEDVNVLTHRLHAIVHALFAQRSRFGLQIESQPFLLRLQRNLRLFAGTTAGLVLLDRDGLRTTTLNALSDAAKGAKLVIIDPLRQFHGGDENDSAAMNDVVLALRQVARQSGAALVFAHHANKAATLSGQGEVAGAARGSSALTDGVRWQVNLSKPTKEQAQQRGIAADARGRYLLLDVAKTNYAPPRDTVMLERLPGGVLATCRLQEPSQTMRARSGKSQARQAQLAGDGQ
jgi:RecA-family ATPase